MLRINLYINKLIKILHKPFTKETILVLGDSHAHVFNHWRLIYSFPKIHFSVCVVGGATASGLENPNSKTKAYEIFMKTVRRERFKKIITMLGEVDTGFVIWYRAKKYGLDVSEMFEQAVIKYTRFLSKLVNDNANLIVISTPLPTIGDKNTSGIVANLRKEIKVSQLERTKLTIKFNQEIERFCVINKIYFINLDSKCIGEDNIVRSELKSKRLTDHHYDINKYAIMISKELRSVI